MINLAEEKKFMLRAIELAKLGTGWTNPNPLVGAVIVKDGKIIGEGFHHRYGDLHAEREALKNCTENGNNPQGATIYVTLEPCCHFGKQPPCTHAVVEAGIKKVVVGSRDPNPLVHGKGNAYLRENGIEVIEDFLIEECDRLNPIFFHYITTKTPYVALKYAMTMDGKIATKTGESKWITGEKSRQFVHALRNRYAGIMCGIGTVLADDPLLNCRLEGGSDPVRIIVDSKLRIPMESQIVKTAEKITTLIVCSEKENVKSLQSEKCFQLESKGVEVLEAACLEDGRIDLVWLMKVLGQRKIDSVLIEGGGTVNYSAISSGIVDYIYAFIAPKIFGGEAKTPVIGTGVQIPSDSYNFKMVKTREIGGDLLVEFEKK